MSSLGEVGGRLRVVLDRVEQVVGLIRNAKDDAVEAAELLAEVGRGSSQEAEFEQASAHWHGAVDQADGLLHRLTAIRELLTAYLDGLLGSGATWADQERVKLPTYITSGRSVDDDGHVELVQSGRHDGDVHVQIGRHLIAEGLVRRSPAGGLPAVGEHVEAKVAWWMRVGGADRVELVINRVICTGPQSCDRLVEYILRPGQVLVVHDPEKRKVFRGRGQ